MEKFVLQWRETFPMNAPQLVSTEQTPSKKENVNTLYFETVCQEQFFKNLVCFCKSMEVLNWLTFLHLLSS